MPDSRPPGYGRGPTPAEIALPPYQRPWTEYDDLGEKQPRPAYIGHGCKALACCGPVCCVWEMQLPECCGEDCDALICKGKYDHLKTCLCCGPRCDQPCCKLGCSGCCKLPCCCDLARSTAGLKRDLKISAQECCACKCCDGITRYSGCVLLCCHCSCLNCPSCCANLLCCREEQMMMDGDLKPLTPPGNAAMVRDGFTPLEDTSA